MDCATNRPQCMDCLGNSLSSFVRQEGTGLAERVQPFVTWRSQRERCGLWPYGRTQESRVGTRVHVSTGGVAGHFVNFGSQDYLGLAQDARVQEAAVRAIRDFGVHSAGSPALIGRTRLLVDVESRLASHLRRERCLLFPTGWAAGYGAVAGLVRPGDAIVIDALAHACLQEGTARATPNVLRFRHNDPADLDGALTKARALSGVRTSGMFVVIESLYSMDSDSPPLAEMMRVARRHDAIVIIDVAHDFGAVGADGLGLLSGHLEGDLSPDVVMGSFSKTFAANGGFIATSDAVAQYLSYYASPLLFSNAMSPVQAAVIAQCLEIVFSGEGERLRDALADRIALARACFEAEGCHVAGTPSPIVPVFVGDEAKARLTSRALAERGVLANLVEFPAVARGKARFRFQMMASHSHDVIRAAAGQFGASVREAATVVGSAA